MKNDALLEMDKRSPSASLFGSRLLRVAASSAGFHPLVLWLGLASSGCAAATALGSLPPQVTSLNATTRESVAEPKVSGGPPAKPTAKRVSPREGARRAWVYGGLALGGAAIATGWVYAGIWGLKVQEAQSEGGWNRCQSRFASNTECPRLLQLQRDARLLFDSSMGFMIAGLGVAQAAALYALIADGASSFRKEVSVVPWSAPGSGGVSVQGAF